MKFFRSLLTNHPLANIAFVVVILIGLLSYLSMPREQDPEINFCLLYTSPSPRDS